jgi:hypothetical protein
VHLCQNQVQFPLSLQFCCLPHTGVPAKKVLIRDFTPTDEAIEKSRSS